MDRLEQMNANISKIAELSSKVMISHVLPEMVKQMMEGNDLDKFHCNLESGARFTCEQITPLAEAQFGFVWHYYAPFNGDVFLSTRFEVAENGTKNIFVDKVMMYLKKEINSNRIWEISPSDVTDELLDMSRKDIEKYDELDQQGIFDNERAFNFFDKVADDCSNAKIIDTSYRSIVIDKKDFEEIKKRLGRTPGDFAAAINHKPI